MSKMIPNLIERLVILEFLIRGPRIKNSAWRVKMGKYLRSKGTNYKIFPPPLNLLVDEHKKIAFLNMPKVAGTSLMRTLLESETMRQDFDRTRNKHKEIPRLGRINWLIADPEASSFFPINMKIVRHHPEGWRLIGQDKDSGWANKNISPDEINSYFIFTFVRNPFSRLVSFFQQKYKYESSTLEGGRYEITLPKHIPFFWLFEVSSFSDLVFKVSRLPDFNSEEHHAPQQIKMDTMKANGMNIDFIGKYETLQKDFEPLKRRFDLLPLEHHNKSTGEKENWRDYYTAKTAKMIYKRFRKDFEMFGYEDEYPKLLDYLAGQRVKKTNDQ